METKAFLVRRKVASRITLRNELLRVQGLGFGVQNNALFPPWVEPGSNHRIASPQRLKSPRGHKHKFESRKSSDLNT